MHKSKDPTDLLGEPLAVGDYVCYGAPVGRSIAITIGRRRHYR